MAMFNFIMKNRDKQFAEREIAPSLLELFNVSNQPPGNAPTNTNMNVDLPQVQPMNQQDLLGGMMRAGAYPRATENALQAQMMPLPTGTSEFERNLTAALKSGKITPEQADELRRKRSYVMAGSELTASQAKTDERFGIKERRVETEGLRDEWREDREHFSNMDKSISGAMAALEAGDNQLADQLLAQVMTQVNDTDVRAYQLITNMDQSYGNVAERTYRSIARFVKGARTPEEKREILKTLSTFKESHVAPGTKRIDRRYRTLGIGKNLDPFDVVPPSSPEDIRDAPGLTKDQKRNALKKWYPDLFR